MKIRERLLIKRKRTMRKKLLVNLKIGSKEKKKLRNAPRRKKRNAKILNRRKRKYLHNLTNQKKS